MQVKVTEHNFRNDAIRWQMQKSTKGNFYIFIFFAYVRPLRKKVTDTQTDRHTDRQTYRETDKPIARDEI